MEEYMVKTPVHSVMNNQVEHKTHEPKITLKVIHMESGDERSCESDEAKEWQWRDLNIIRIVNGAHIASWTKLAEIIREQEEKGAADLVVYEAPRFMLLGGG
jgi:hypothetical protein